MTKVLFAIRDCEWESIPICSANHSQLVPTRLPIALSGVSPVKVSRAASVMLVIALVAAACGNGDGAEGSGADADPRATVVVTTAIWADVVSAIGCDQEMVVETLIPPGADPHSYEPSLADRARMEGATLVVANGLGLEEGVEDTIDAVQEAGTPVFRFGDHMDTRVYATGETDDAGRGAVDPHVWFDPLRVVAAVPALETAMVDAGFDDGATHACAGRFIDTVEQLHARIVEMAAVVPPASRGIVTNHDSLGYFADRYGFEILATVLPTPSGLAEANPGQLERVAELIEREGVAAIFVEAQQADEEARALAGHLEGIDVVALSTGPGIEDALTAEGYPAFLLEVASSIIEALDDG